MDELQIETQEVSHLSDELLKRVAMDAVRSKTRAKHAGFHSFSQEQAAISCDVAAYWGNALAADCSESDGVPWLFVLLTVEPSTQPPRIDVGVCVDVLDYSGSAVASGSVPIDGEIRPVERYSLLGLKVTRQHIVWKCKAGWSGKWSGIRATIDVKVSDLQHGTPPVCTRLSVECRQQPIPEKCDKEALKELLELLNGEWQPDFKKQPICSLRPIDLPEGMQGRRCWPEGLELLTPRYKAYTKSVRAWNEHLRVNLDLLLVALQVDWVKNVIRNWTALPWRRIFGVNLSSELLSIADVSPLFRQRINSAATPVIVFELSEAIKKADDITAVRQIGTAFPRVVFALDDAEPKGLWMSFQSLIAPAPYMVKIDQGSVCRAHGERGSREDMMGLQLRNGVQGRFCIVLEGIHNSQMLKWADDLARKNNSPSLFIQGEYLEPTGGTSFRCTLCKLSALPPECSLP